MPLLGKRKRAASEPATLSITPSVRAPLTAENLATVCAMSSSEKTQKSAASRASSQTNKSKALASAVKLQRQLEHANIRLESKVLRPQALQDLVSSLLDEEVPESPSAAQVVKLYPSIVQLYERDGICKAHPHLIGKGALEEAGMAMVSSCLDMPLERAYLPEIEDRVTRQLHGVLAQAQPWLLAMILVQGICSVFHELTALSDFPWPLATYEVSCAGNLCFSTL